MRTLIVLLQCTFVAFAASVLVWAWRELRAIERAQHARKAETNRTAKILVDLIHAQHESRRAAQHEGPHAL